MAKSSENFDEGQVQLLMEANEQAVRNLRMDIERLRGILELSALKASKAQDDLVKNLKENEEALKKLIVTGEDLQAELIIYNQERERRRKTES